MYKEKFLKDLKTAYAILVERDKEVHRLYTPDAKEKAFLGELLAMTELKVCPENEMAAAGRIVALKEDGLVQALKKSGKNEAEIDAISLAVYRFVADFYLWRHREFLDILKDRELLSPFYRALLEGVHRVGVAMSDWQPVWTQRIIHTQNKELKERFGNSAKVAEFLRQNVLLETDAQGEVCDRSYSVLDKQGEGYVKRTYAEAFKGEVSEVAKELDALLEALLLLEDEVFEQKKEWLHYFDAIKTAFLETEPTQVVARWADVDRAWMEVKTPIQVGHPLEYYEDHYRKAVALEWDVRFINPSLQDDNCTGACLADLSERVLGTVGGDAKLAELVKNNIDRTQLYIGRPALFYGAEFSGLFSAQVVPNDEEVSREKGKKIFAFADFVLAGARAKPFMQIDSEIFGQDFLERERQVLFRDEALWHRLYDIETIGHEYGHVLWMDSDTETVMNASGNFKNLEEFKATSGGLVAHFSQSDAHLEDIFISVIKRAVKLVGWMETGEVEPYYAEGLLHLSGMFETGVLGFDAEAKDLAISLDTEDLQRLKSWYLATYEALASHYVSKEDALDFLGQYMVKHDYFKPLDENTRAFVEHYWDRYRDIGQVVDESLNKDDWLS